MIKWGGWGVWGNENWLEACRVTDQLQRKSPPRGIYNARVVESGSGLIPKTCFLLENEIQLGIWPNLTCGMFAVRQRTRGSLAQYWPRQRPRSRR